MSWIIRGDEDHDRITISGSGGENAIRHIVYEEKDGSGMAVITQTFSSNDSKHELGHTTVHGNDWVNYHGSHQDYQDSDLSDYED